MRRVFLLALGVAVVGAMVIASISVAARITGTNGNDFLVGTSSEDRIAGGAGDDEVRGRNGPDNLDGDSGDDFVHGNNGRDDVFGSQGRDHLHGGRRSDFINSVDNIAGNDRIRCDGGPNDKVRRDRNFNTGARDHIVNAGQCESVVDNRIG